MYDLHKEKASNDYLYLEDLALLQMALEKALREGAELAMAAGHAAVRSADLSSGIKNALDAADA